MTELQVLPVCRYRGTPLSEGMFSCLSPKVSAPNGVEARTCMTCSVMIRDAGRMRFATPPLPLPLVPPQMDCVSLSRSATSRRTIVAVICHRRADNLASWLRAWDKSANDNAVLYVVSTGSLAPPSLPAGAKWLPMPNEGYDIGAVKRFIDAPPEPYDLLFWAPDDFLPMRKDWLNLYRAPFEDSSVGMVGTWWGINHVRSGGVCVNSQVAREIRFPQDILEGGPHEHHRYRCLRFEHGDMNFYRQVVKKGWGVRLADGSTPPRSPFWENQHQQFILWDKGDRRRWMNYPAMQRTFDSIWSD